MENRLIHLIAQLDSLRHEYYDQIKLLDLKGYSENRAFDISVKLNQICARMLSVQADLNIMIHKLMRDNKDLRVMITKKAVLLPDTVVDILKGNK